MAEYLKRGGGAVVLTSLEATRRLHLNPFAMQLLHRVWIRQIRQSSIHDVDVLFAFCWYGALRIISVVKRRGQISNETFQGAIRLGETIIRTFFSL